MIGIPPKETASVTRQRFHAPNSRKSMLDQWRRDGRVRAIGSLTYYGGLISGKRLAAIIGISPRGLRQMLRGDPVFSPEIRESDQGRGETWYRLNHDALPPREEPPRLIRVLTPAAPRIAAPQPEESDNCAPVTTAKRGR